MNKDTKKILESAIQMEKDGIEFYTEAAGKIENPMGSRMFNSIVEDEKRHLKKLENVSQNIGLVDVGKPAAGTLNRRLKTIFSEIPEDVQESLNVHTQELKVISAAIRMEEEGIRFYSENRANLEGKAKELCSFIVEEERNHRNILQNTLQYLEENSSWNVETENWFFEG